MSKKTKKKSKTQPDVLGRLFNLTVSNRQAKVMVFEKAEKLKQEALAVRLPEKNAAIEIPKQLRLWIENSGLDGHGTKKLVDKAAAKVLKTYQRDLDDLEELRFVDLPVESFGTWAYSAKQEARWVRRNYR